MTSAKWKIFFINIWNSSIYCEKTLRSNNVKQLPLVFLAYCRPRRIHHHYQCVHHQNLVYVGVPGTEESVLNFSIRLTRCIMRVLTYFLFTDPLIRQLHSAFYWAYMYFNQLSASFQIHDSITHNISIDSQSSTFLSGCDIM